MNSKGTRANKSTNDGTDARLMDNPYSNWFLRSFSVGEFVSLGTVVEMLRNGTLHLENATLTLPRTGYSVRLDRRPDGSLKSTALIDSMNCSESSGQNEGKVK